MNILKETTSVCPNCLERIPASYVEKSDGYVYMEKSCKKHGNFSTIVWDGAEDFLRWQSRPLANNKPYHCESEVNKGCPYDCGLCEEHKQLSCCVLIEVTQRCNLSCPTCFAQAGDNFSDDLSLEDTEKFYDMLLRCGGPFNIQLSGGEPSLRDDLDDIIKQGKDKGFTFFQLNTNGLRLANDPSYLHRLASAGLNTVFLQFDGFKESTYNALRGKFLLDEKLKAIKNCSDEGIGVVLVPTLRSCVNYDEIGKIIEFALEHMPDVRGVHFQPMSFFGRYDGSPENHDRLTIADILNAIESQTNGKMPRRAFSPGGAEHPLCSFHADFTLMPDSSLKFRENPEPQSCCCSASDASQQAGRVVARKWSGKAVRTTRNSITNTYPGIDISSIDAFLDAKQNNTLAVSGMAFQDAWNLDLERLKRCYINEISPEAKLIPFCAYNLTDTQGNSIYR